MNLFICSKFRYPNSLTFTEISAAMVECLPFLLVQNINQTINWYQDVGFTCVATNQIWEPDGELNWARLEWKGAAFMIGPDVRNSFADQRDTGIWFNVDSVDDITDILEERNIKINIEPETFYGRKVVAFRDLNGYEISFSCKLPDK